MMCWQRITMVSAMILHRSFSSPRIASEAVRGNFTLDRASSHVIVLSRVYHRNTLRIRVCILCPPDVCTPKKYRRPCRGWHPHTTPDMYNDAMLAVNLFLKKKSKILTSPSGRRSRLLCMSSEQDLFLAMAPPRVIRGCRDGGFVY